MKSEEPDIVEINIRISRDVARRMLARSEHERAVLNLVGAGAIQEALIKLEHGATDA